MTSKAIKEKALQLGFSACGIIPAEPFEEYREALDSRVKVFPEAESVYTPLYGFINPPQGAKSIIVCIAGYNQFKVPEKLAKYVGKHYLFDGRLEYTEEFRVKAEFTTFLKNAGIDVLSRETPDRIAAVKAGLGYFGRNNFFYTEEHGSYNIIHSWVVDAALDYDTVCELNIPAKCSEKCLACVRACPTNALCDSLKMNRAKCIPHMLTDTKNPPNPLEAETEKSGIWLYGCDVCQDVCPMNRGKLTQAEDFPLLTQYEEYMQPENILEMDDKTYREIINPRFWYIGKENIWLWKCNALRAIINSGDEKHHPLIKKYSTHEDPRLQAIAQWGCEKLGL